MELYLWAAACIQCRAIPVVAERRDGDVVRVRCLPCGTDWYPRAMIENAGDDGPKPGKWRNHQHIRWVD